MVTTGTMVTSSDDASGTLVRTGTGTPGAAYVPQFMQHMKKEEAAAASKVSLF
jgi:hypothetical protein